MLAITSFFSISETVGAISLFMKAKMDCLLPVIWRRFLDFFIVIPRMFTFSLACV